MHKGFDQLGMCRALGSALVYFGKARARVLQPSLGSTRVLTRARALTLGHYMLGSSFTTEPRLGLTCARVFQTRARLGLRFPGSTHHYDEPIKRAIKST